MATELARKPIDVEGLACLTDEAVMGEISALLGYKGVEGGILAKKVADILAGLGIEPFNPETVAAYKGEAAKALTKTRTNTWGDQVTVKGKWVAIPLATYTKAVPTFALLRAAEVKKALNAAQITGDFWIEELTTETRTTKARNYDPFMVLRVNDNNYHIDVWNEPKFEGRRIK